MKAASLRCSEAGYWNDFIPILDYTTLDKYIGSIEALVNEGKLCTPWELYLPVRLKPRGANDLNNLRKGIDHIELRMIDLNPLYKNGVCKKDLEFIHLMLIYFAASPPFSFNKTEQELAVKNMQESALLKDDIKIRLSPGKSRGIREAAMDVLQDMEAFFSELDSNKIADTLAFQKEKLTDESRRYVNRIFKELSC